MRRAALAVAALLLSAEAPSPVLEVEVAGVRNGRGQVMVAVCTRASFLTARCEHVGRAPAVPGTTRVRIPGVPPGIWAVQAWHDENEDEKINRNFLGLPTEGLGFSRDAPFRFGPPAYDDAAFRLGPEGGRVRLTLRYLG